MCVFCSIASKQTKASVVYENEHIMAFLDCEPINEGHILVIPKKHYLDVDELPTELLTEIMEISQKIVKALNKIYEPNGYTIMQNGGKFNDIGHYHLHIFPRYGDDEFGWVTSEKNFEYSQDVANKIAEALN